MEWPEGRRLILQEGWLAEQGEEIRVAVIQRARLARHEAGDFVFHAGDEAGGICGVVSGGIGIYLPTGDDDIKLAHIGRCGVWFGYGPMIRGRRRSLSFSPIETTWLMHVPLAALQEIARISLGHQRAILSVSEYGMDVAIRIIENLLIQNHAHRIAATLLRVIPRHDEHDDRQAGIVLTQAQLGEMASVGRQVVNRELRRMVDKGWIRSSYGKIAVLDRGALTEFAQGRE